MDLPMIRRFLHYLRPYRFPLAGVFICASIVSGLWAAQAYLVQPVLDEIFIKKNRTMLLYLPLAVLGISALKGLANYVRGYLIRFVAHNVIQDIRNQLYHHILVMPLDFFSKHATGTLMSRVLNDVALLQNVLSNVVKSLFQQVITMIFLTGVMFYQNWRLTLVALVVLPFSYYPIRKFSKRLRKISHAGQEKMANLSTLLQETFAGIRIVKAFTAEGLEAERFRSKNLEYFKNMMKATRISELTPSLMEFFGAMGAAFIIWTGGYQVIQGTITPGAFFSFLAACWLMYAPIRSISTAHNTIQQSLAAVERVFAVLDLETELARDRDKKILPPFSDRIEFENVSYRYEDGAEPALQDVNFSVTNGEVIALVGLSGAGKTTLVNLIPRFFEPTTGVIRIDGMNIREATLESLRRQIGIVSQETVLFDDTVARNIAYGSPGATPDQIEAAAVAAYAHDFIRETNDGYRTIIGERGMRLSGGQRQRIAIARALLKNPPILILDEATSNLDVESEQTIQKALARLLTGRTTFVIAHRLSTVMNARRIFVIEAGRIRDVGRHGELLEKSDLYRRLYELQFKDVPRYAGQK